MVASWSRWVWAGSFSSAFHFVFLLIAFLLPAPNTQNDVIIPIEIEVRRETPPVPIGLAVEVAKPVNTLSPPPHLQAESSVVNAPVSPISGIKPDNEILAEEDLGLLASSHSSSDVVLPEEHTDPKKRTAVASVGVPGHAPSSGGSGTGGVGQQAGPVYIPLMEVTRMPVFKAKAAPVYPAQARTQEKEGVVTLEVSISEKGKVMDIVVVQKAGFGFDEAAIEAIKQSTFEPAYVGDRPVAVIVRLPIRFRFSD